MKLVILLFFSMPAFAGPYVSVGGALFSESVDDPPDITATHPVDRVERSEKDEALGVSVSLGYRWPQWYVEAGWAELALLDNKTIQRGEDGGGNIHATTSSREEDVDTIELKLGRTLGLTESISLYGELGAHRYSKTITIGQEHVEQDPFGGIVGITSSESVSEETDTDALFGAGVVFAMPDGVGLKVGVTRYAGVDRTAAAFVFQIGF